MVIRRIGRLTQVIHQLKVGDELGIRGPYGSGFDLDGFLRKGCAVCGRRTRTGAAPVAHHSRRCRSQALWPDHPHFGMPQPGGRALPRSAQGLGERRHQCHPACGRHGKHALGIRRGPCHGAHPETETRSRKDRRRPVRPAGHVQIRHRRSQRQEMSAPTRFMSTSNGA